MFSSLFLEVRPVERNNQKRFHKGRCKEGVIPSFWQTGFYRTIVPKDSEVMFYRRIVYKASEVMFD